MATWDPATYLQFADQRGRPFADLVARIGAEAPRTVVDLGCGPGQLTAGLATRWPTATVTGVDASAEMVEQARQHAGPGLAFTVGDLREWRPDEPVDVLVSNATLQWVPQHRALLPRLVGALAPGGWFAFQVPGNFGEPSHRLLHELAADPRFARATAHVERPSSAEPEDYLADLVALGCTVDVWETTYLHVLSGPDPVFRWISGTGARPVLQALDGPRRAEFELEYRALLDAAYPPGPAGTVLPFRRIFAVAQRPAPTGPGDLEGSR
jgi:trans-aconitate 2-methyltransferase